MLTVMQRLQLLFMVYCLLIVNVSWATEGLQTEPNHLGTYICGEPSITIGVPSSLYINGSSTISFPVSINKASYCENVFTGSDLKFSEMPDYVSGCTARSTHSWSVGSGTLPNRDMKFAAVGGLYPVQGFADSLFDVTCQLTPNIHDSMMTVRVKLAHSEPDIESYLSSKQSILLYTNLPPVSKPQCSFSASRDWGKAPLMVKFKDLSIGNIKSWNWEFGDGTFSTLKNCSHRFTTPGVYEVELTVKGAGGLHSHKTQIWVDGSQPTANFSSTPKTGFAPLTVNFSDRSRGFIDSWFWSFGDNWTSKSRNTSHTFDSPGQYSVILNTTGPGGSSSKSSIITVKSAIQRLETPQESPQGSIESIECSGITGWTTGSDPSSPISVQLYADGPVGHGQFIGAFPISTQIDNLSDKKHQFIVPFPSSLNDGNSHALYAYANDQHSGLNVLLENSPKAIACKGLQTKRIQITSPTSLSELESDRQNIITWTSENITGPVSIQYSLNDRAIWHAIESNTINDGYINWYFGYDQNICNGDTEGYIKIISINNPDIFDISPKFIIKHKKGFPGC